jgi:hypothetical protein
MAVVNDGLQKMCWTQSHSCTNVAIAATAVEHPKGPNQLPRRVSMTSTKANEGSWGRCLMVVLATVRERGPDCAL